MDYGERLIKGFESLRLTRYNDGGGVPTIGWGHRILPAEHEFLMPISEARAQEVFLIDFGIAAAAVDRLVKVPVNAVRRAALTSFVFNLGVGAFAESTLLKKLNGRKGPLVPGQLMRWIHDNGKVERGLVRRRGAEVALWNGDLVKFEALLANDRKACAELYSRYVPK